MVEFSFFGQTIAIKGDSMKICSWPDQVKQKLEGYMGLDSALSPQLLHADLWCIKSTACYH